jgi:hypothetical protein
MFVQTEERVQMKKLMFFAVVAMIGASAFATQQGGWPRVYQYAATLNTAVAKNAKTVKYTNCDREMGVDVCYRVKGTVSLKGVVVFDCGCVDMDVKDFSDGYPLMLVGTSSDNYTHIVEADSDGVWAANRLGSPISSKAKVAELGFMLDVKFGECARSYVLGHAGFGTAGSINGEDTLDILTISGNVVGGATAPFCSADEGNCPRCVNGTDCEMAIGFEPCTVDDCYYRSSPYWGVAYGTFTLKYNPTLATAIKDIPVEEVCETAAVLVPKVFGKNAINPLGPCMMPLAE